jgi:hypothetical protein
MLVVLAVMALSVGALAPAGAAPGGGRTVPGAATEAAARPTAPPTAGSPAPVPGALRASAATPDGGSVSAAADWALINGPNRGPNDNHLHEVSCVNATRCVAVGYNEHPVTGHRQSVVETLVNGVWKVGKIPHRGTSLNTLWNVSCVPGNKCFAVGYYADVAAGYYRTLIARYWGGYWTLMSSPNVANTDNYLFGIDCVDATHCVAVGRYLAKPSLRLRTLVLTMNGSTWQVTKSPNRQATTRDNYLSDVSCADLDHCVAVGYSLTQAVVYETLGIELASGVWTLRSTRNVDGASNLLRDVSCPTVDTCVAVGGTDPGTANEQTLIQRLSAGVWAIEPSPNRASTDNHLWGVSCKTDVNCVAVGQSQNTERSWTLVTTLDAGTWTQTPSPSRGGTFNFLYGLSCPTIAVCYAAGDYINLGTDTYRTLIATNAG